MRFINICNSCLNLLFGKESNKKKRSISKHMLEKRAYHRSLNFNELFLYKRRTDDFFE